MHRRGDGIKQRAPAVQRQHLPGHEPRRLGGQKLCSLGQFGGRRDPVQGRVLLDVLPQGAVVLSVACIDALITEPKAIEFTRILCGASDTASERVIWSSAAEVTE